MKCPICHQAELVGDSHDQPYHYKGRTLIVSDLPGEWCPACGEGLLGPEATDRFMTRVKAFREAVDGGMLQE